MYHSWQYTFLSSWMGKNLLLSSLLFQWSTVTEQKQQQHLEAKLTNSRLNIRKSYLEIEHVYTLPASSDLPLPCALSPFQPCRHSVRKPPSPSDPLPRPVSLSPTLTATPPLRDYSHLLPPFPSHLSTLTYPFPAPSVLPSHVDTLSASLQAPQTHSLGFRV